MQDFVHPRPTHGKIRDTLFRGPYNKDPTIYNRALDLGSLSSEAPISSLQGAADLRSSHRDVLLHGSHGVAGQLPCWALP